MSTLTWFRTPACFNASIVVRMDGIVVVDGVGEGETVVTDGQLRLTNGAKIRVTDPASKPATQPTTALAEKLPQ